jgi:hypothetical protein
MTLKSGLEDAFAAGETNSDNIGRKIILLSSFTNGPRHLFQLYNDSMAIVTAKGLIGLFFNKFNVFKYLCLLERPDLFLTMTCNPRWQEIQKDFLPGKNLLSYSNLNIF